MKDSSRQPSILVVDDDPDSRIFFEHEFSNNGFQGKLRFLQTRRAIRKYLAYLGENCAAETAVPLRAILVASYFPGWELEGLIQALRAAPGLRNVPVVVLTASAVENEYWQEKLPADGTRFLVKPVREQDLKSLLEGVS